MTFYTSQNATGRETLVEALRWMTVYESANAVTPRDRVQRIVKRNGDLLSNSAALMATSVITSVLGFAFWWVAARSFSAEAVGAASAAISAMTLIGYLGMFGMGTLLLAELPKARERQWSLISTCVLVAALASTVGAVIYLGLAAFVIPGLRDSLESPLGALLLVVATCLNGATLVLDQGMVGLLAGHLQLLRNSYFALSKLVFLFALVLVPFAASGTGILTTWIAGIVVSLLLIAPALRARGRGARIRPQLSMMHGLAKRAMGHNVLNMSLFLPGVCVPLVVTSVVSTSATAGFYTASMVMGALEMIPGSIAVTLFAVASGDIAALRAKVRIGLAIAFGLGMPVSLGIALFGRPLMGLFGKGYGSTAGAALSLLALTYAGTVVRLFYVTIARIHKRIRQATVVAVAFGVVELVAAWEGGRRGGLMGLATWLTVTLIAEGVVLTPSLLKVVLARVSAPLPAQEGADTRSGTKAAAMSLGANAMPHRAPTRIRRKRSGRGTSRPLSIPRSNPALPRVDETAIIPLRRMDETAVIPRQRDETPIVPRRDTDTMVFGRPALDETAEIPRIVDEPPSDNGTNGDGAKGAGFPVHWSAVPGSIVDSRGDAATDPRTPAAWPPAWPYERRTDADEASTYGAYGGNP